ncbi:MAG: CpaF family protein [Cyanobacteria bacterium P01_H01_bin.74]
MSLRDRLKKNNLTSNVEQSPTDSKASDFKTSSVKDATSNKTSGPFTNKSGGINYDTKNTAAKNATAEASKGEQFDEIKVKVHKLLVESMDVSETDNISKSDVTTIATQMLEQALLTQKVPMGQTERSLLIQELIEEVIGLGPLEPLLRDQDVSEIMVNGPKNIYIERGGKLQRTRVVFKDNDHVLHIIERIVSAVGRRIDEKTPMVDARLKDGSRFNAIIPPLALDGPSISIRKFKSDAGSLEKLLAWGSINNAMCAVLQAAVKCHLNIVISGGTGSGKTTMLNALSGVINEDERIVTIEDSAELQLKQDHVVRLETRPANIEGEGRISARDLLINSLRMRPDRIVIGECRGAETLEMLQAMNTGHDGSLTTLHSNTPRDAITRIITMCMMNENPLPEKNIRQQIAAAVHLIVQVNRLPDGQRKTTSITEVVGIEGDVITMQEIFKYQQNGVDINGNVVGEHLFTGVRPKFTEKCIAKGIPLPDDLFQEKSHSSVDSSPEKKSEEFLVFGPKSQESTDKA